MATQKQNAANRSNAQRSTGPSSPDGKARAAMNNFQHGIYAKSPIAPGEDPAQRKALEDAYLTRFIPRTIEQLYLVYILIQLHWENLRLDKADAHLWTRGIKDAYKPQPDSVFGQAFQNNRETFLFLGRRRDANHRKYIATIRELESLQSVPLPDDLDAMEQSDTGTDPGTPPPTAAEPAVPAAETPEMASNPQTAPTGATPAPDPPATPPPAPPEAPAAAPQPVETAAKTPEMASNPQTPPPAPEPRPPAPDPRPLTPGPTASSLWTPAHGPSGMAPQSRSPAHRRVSRLQRPRLSQPELPIQGTKSELTIGETASRPA